MTTEDVEKVKKLYIRLSYPNYLIQLVPLYFIVDTLASTDRHFGVGSAMRLYLGQSHRLLSVRHGTNQITEFRMCPLPMWRNSHSFSDQISFSYSHHDISPTGQTKALMNSIFSTKTIQDKIKEDNQILKFNTKNIYDFSA